MNKNKLRKNTYLILESGFSGKLSSKVLSGFIVVLIMSNVIAVILESYEPIGGKYREAFYMLNLISVLIFTIEYFSRVWASIEAERYDKSTPIRSRLKYVCSAVAIIDLLAILPFYIAFIVPIDLRYLRLLRMLRLLKLTHYFRGLNLFVSVLKQELVTLCAALFIMLLLVIFSASVIYGVEHSAQPEVFDSIPSAIWWSVVTMTTVGYGDAVPVTLVGKFIASFIMLLGVGVVALPAAMLAATFGEELRNRKLQLESEIAHALEDGIVSKHERKILDKLAEELHVSGDVLERLIDSGMLQKSIESQCPHCKKTISKRSA